MNYVFLSPHFPHNFKHFVVALKKEGVKVLGIASDPYESLDQELKDSLTEYYMVDDMESYDALLKACGYFTFKYGKIDFIESHNEYWLETEAKLRTDFNVAGYKISEMDPIKKKSEMKKVFMSAGISVAKGIIVKDYDEVKKFIDEVGYPVCVKPNIGVGGANTYKLDDESELDFFLNTKPSVEYFMEEFVYGDVNTFDGLVDKDGEILFLNSFIYSDSVLDTIFEGLNQFYYCQKNIPDDLMEEGLKALREFDIRERFFHFEFFRTEDNELVALEVNVRPPGGQSLDMFNYGSDIDIYERYAKMISNQKIDGIPEIKYYCGYIGLKKEHKYNNSIEEVMEEYGDIITSHGPVPQIFSDIMGDYSFIARSEDFDKLLEATDFILSQAD